MKKSEWNKEYERNGKSKSVKESRKIRGSIKSKKWRKRVVVRDNSDDLW